jgi:hypothetical protein
MGGRVGLEFLLTSSGAKIITVSAPEQAPDIVLDRRFYRPRSLAEVAAEALAEVRERLTDPGQQPHCGGGGRVFQTRSSRSLS